MIKLHFSRNISLLALAAGLSLTGCHYHETPAPPPCYQGYNGVSGRAWFSIDWVDVPPAYLWTDNPAIPATFYYGDWYQSPPGNFRLYYEGSYIVNCCPQYYYWDVYFDIWIHPGTSGGCGYNGVNGVDSYLGIVCGPMGPYDQRTNKTDDGVRVISDTGDEIIVEKTIGDLTMRITYKKLNDSLKPLLNAGGEIKGADKAVQ